MPGDGPVPLARLLTVLQTDYGLPGAQIRAGPRGADRDSCLYRVQDSGGGRRLLKWRRGQFNPAALRLPFCLQARGEPAFIAPQPTLSGVLQVDVGDGQLTLFPHVAARSGFERPLDADAWRQLGRALRALHATPLPDDLLRALPRERFTPQTCAGLQRLPPQTGAAQASSLDATLTQLLQDKRMELDWLCETAAGLAHALRARDLPLVPCHGDVHAGNVMVDAQNRLFLVDFDTLQLAPPERDLMFIGAGVAGHWQSPQESVWFHEGYGRASPDPAAIACYRCERIIADVLDYCEQIAGPDLGQDRNFALAELQRQLAPGPELRIARASVAALS